MNDSQSVLIGVLATLMGYGTWLVLKGAIVVLAIYMPRLRARGWLVAAGSLFVISSAWRLTGQLILDWGSHDTYFNYFQSVYPIFSTIDVTGSSCLLIFIFGQRTSAGSQLPFRQILFSFQGRIARQHYWVTTFALGVVGWMPSSIMLRASRSSASSYDKASLTAATVSYVLWLLVVLWPMLAIQVKRWHDRNKSGWMVLVNLIPIIGPIWSFVEVGCLRGTLGANRYGDDPLAPASEGQSSALEP